MKYRLMGNSGLRVSELGLGAMTFGTEGWGVDEAESRKVYEGFREAGGNFIDTANVYEGYKRFLGSPGGTAEEIVGKAIQGKRDQFVVATKVCAPMGPGPQDRRELGGSAIGRRRPAD